MLDGARDVTIFSLILRYRVNQTKSAFFLVFFVLYFKRIPTSEYIVIVTNVVQYITNINLFKYTENLTLKNENFKIKILIYFLICTQNIDCGYSLEPPHRGGSNEYPQSMLLRRNKKNNVYPLSPPPPPPRKPQFYYTKVGFKGVKII